MVLSKEGSCEDWLLVHKIGVNNQVSGLEFAVSGVKTHTWVFHAVFAADSQGPNDRNTFVLLVLLLLTRNNLDAHFLYSSAMVFGTGCNVECYACFITTSCLRL